jgi:plasmid stability protein
VSTLAIREIDDHVVEVLKNRAVGHHRSLAGEVRAILTDVAKGVPVEIAGLTAEEVASRSKRATELSFSYAPSTSTASRDEIYGDDGR